MAEIAASTVMELRSRTGLGMMECKKALAETGGDLAKAEELLRVRSGAKASKAASRIAAEGVVGAWLAADAKSGAMVEVNCETDFVARNEDFVAFARKLAELVAGRNPADVATLSALPLDGGTIETVRQALVQKIGENMTIRRFRRFQTSGRLASYVHGGGRIGVLVEFDGGDEALGKDIAMHIAASGAPGAIRPVAVSRNDVPSDLIAKERAIFAQQAAESGKPAEIVAKMVEGRVAKFLSEVTLLGQPFVKNPDETVEKVLKAKQASVRAFAMFVVGEGLEKKKDDFAAEVAAMAKA
ncbi:MAG: elongation factor Ts [Burkholderiales bacterium]|nr:elongation factor Ts [Burkholderiales bacterium]MCE7878402.1 elongation factor Ts [Betaproteobacteria bacterium PRO3]